MAVPTLTPSSTISAIVLPVTGTLTTAQTLTSYPFGIYANSETDLYDPNFISGALDQVAYTYKKLGGDVLDIELVEENVYAAYEESVLEYSYIVNIYQGKSMLTDVLGASTGTFDHDGKMITYAGSEDVKSKYNLKYPKFDF